MACNKVIYDGSTLIDLTSDTVKAGSLFKGVTAHMADGTVITGTAEATVTGGVLNLPAGLMKETES